MTDGFFYFELNEEAENVPRREDEKARGVYYSRVFGPFESRLKAKDHMTVRHPSDHAARFLLIQGEILSVARNPLERAEAEKRKPDEKNWTQGEAGHWACNDCGATIQAVRVAHPVHDGPFPLSGSGRCEYTEAGYCPNCDKKPSADGHPISG